MKASPQRTATVVFFDIDGTILHMAGAGRRAFIRALQHAFGWDDEIEYINFAGATDLQVLDRIGAHHGYAMTDADRERFFDRMALELEETVREANAVVHPGIVDLIERLASHPDVLVGLITGNEARCARIKLRRFDLQGHFLLGAFGHEHADRAEIARLALRRAEKHLAPARRPGALFLVGDTPSDIHAAHAIGASAIAVATGSYSVGELNAAGADIALDHLGDTARAWRLFGL